MNGKPTLAGRQNFIFGACCVDEAVEGASDLSQNSTDASGILSSIEKLLSKLDKPALILSNGQIMPIQEVDKTRPLPSSDPNEDELEQESEETTTKNSVKIEDTVKNRQNRINWKWEYVVTCVTLLT